MVAKKKIVNQEKVQSQEDLYICIHDSTTKRKNLLNALKDSLIVQEEAETSLKLRKEKVLTQKEIKKNIDKINSTYQNIKKILPNVKNVLNFTEKEIKELDSQIDSLKMNVENQKEEIKSKKELKKKLTKKEEIETTKEQEEIFEAVNVEPQEKAKKTFKKNNVQEMNKLDRIKNNLSLIESKLKKL